MLIERNRSQLLLIDIQIKLAPHVADADAIVANCVRLARYASRLGVPATLTEHYPRGLGATVGPILTALGNDVPRLEKIAFSSWKDDAIRDRFDRLRRDGCDQVVVAGMEAHVCVGQTVLDLVAEGFHVFLVADAVGSRSTLVRDLAVRRLANAGARIVAHEMVAFEWLGRGDTKEFKDLIEVIK
jgi:nicotinamidase-related amidase